MNAKRQTQQGFTLIELLIALMLFGLVSVLAWRGLDSVLQSRAAVERPGRAALELAAAWTQWDADLQAARATIRSGSPAAGGSVAGPMLPFILASAQRLELLREPSQCRGCWEGVIYDLSRLDNQAVLRRRTTAPYPDAEAAQAALRQLSTDEAPGQSILPQGATEHVLLRGAVGMRIAIWQESTAAAAVLGTWVPLGLEKNYVIPALAALTRATGKSAVKVDWQLGAPWDGWVSKVVLLENRW